MDRSTEPRVALITGAARRIGAGIARTLHAHGLRVAIHHNRSADAARQLVGELEAARAGSARAFAQDLLDIGRIDALVDRVHAAWGRLDVLINNASTFYPTPVGTVTAEQWHDLLGTNLAAPFFLAQAAAARMGEGSVIVNLTDIHGERPLAGYPVYSAAKAGLMAMTRALAVELGPAVRVNAVSPGAILWAEHPAADEDRDALLERTVLGRTGTPGDIAAAVLYLVRDAPYVTGAVLPVDGGQRLTR